MDSIKTNNPVDGTKCTDEELKLQGTFSKFDFQNIWEIDNYRNYPYPQLKSSRQELIQSIELLSPPTNNQVIEGLLPDLSGATVKIVYADGFEIVTEATSQMLSELDINQIGVQTIHLTYGGQKTAETVDIEVIPKSITSIAVTTLPTKATYVEGQPLNPDGGELTVYYNNNNSETVPLADAQLSYPLDKIGVVTVIAEYQGFTVSFEVEFVAKSIESISVTAPTKTEYLEGKDELDVTGGKVILHYNDGTTEEIVMTADMVTGFDNTKLGKQTLTVTYEERALHLILLFSL